MSKIDELRIKTEGIVELIKQKHFNEIKEEDIRGCFYENGCNYHIKINDEVYQVIIQRRHGIT